MDLAVLGGMGALLERSRKLSAVVECSPSLLAKVDGSVGLLLRELRERFDTVQVIVAPDHLLEARSHLLAHTVGGLS
jgi:hypothetical protein